MRFGRRHKPVEKSPAVYQSGLRKEPYPEMLATSPAWIFIKEVLLDIISANPWKTWEDVDALTPEEMERLLAKFNTKYRLAMPVSLSDVAKELESRFSPEINLRDQELLLLARALVTVNSVGMQKALDRLLGHR